MKSALRIAAFTALILGGCSATAQAPKPALSAPTPTATPEIVTPKAPYDDTKALLALKSEQVDQLQATEIQRNFQEQLKALQNDYTQQEQILNVWEAVVRSANGWDESYQFDHLEHKWTHAVKPQKAEEKPRGK